MRLFCLLLLLPLASAVSITEIMYNPEGSDFAYEYVEIAGSGRIDGWHFEGIDYAFPENTTLPGVLIVANDNESFLARYGLATPHSYGGTLANDGESIILRDEKGDIVDVATYTDDAATNESLHRDGASWRSGPATPGIVAERSSSCDFALELLGGGIANESRFRLRALRLAGEGKDNVTIRHWVEDEEGNNVTDYAPLFYGDVSRQRTSSTYTPRLTAGAAYRIRAEMAVSCTDENPANDLVDELVYLPATAASLETSLAIIEARQKGSTLDATLAITKGETAKYAATLWATQGRRRISEQTTVHVRGTQQAVTVKVPLVLIGCEDGDALLHAEGLGFVDEHTLELESCPAGASSSSGSSALLLLDLLDAPTRALRNETIVTAVRIVNGADHDERVDVEARLVRGSREISTTASRSVLLQGREVRKIVLTLTPQDIGNATLKVRLRREGKGWGYHASRDVLVEDVAPPPCFEPRERIVERVSYNAAVLYADRDTLRHAPVLVGLGLFLAAITINRSRRTS